MNVLDPRRRDLPRNLPAEFEPERAGGHSCPSANALKDGPDSEVTRVPEDADAVSGRSKLWYAALRPQNLFHAWLVDQVSITTLRIERVARIERRLRDRAALRASLFWDDDRQLEAEALGGGILDDPAAVVNRLRRTPHGCDWMVDRWARLAHAAGLPGGWTEAQRALAFALLGIGASDRRGEPGGSVDLDGRLASPAPAPGELARREVLALLARREEVAGQDRIDRALAEADLADDPSPASLANRRYDRALHDRLKWTLRQLQYESPRKAFAASLISYFDPPSEPEPEPPPLPEVHPAPESEPEPDPAPEETIPEPVAAPAPLSRVDARLAKAEARRKSRGRRLDRRRN